MEEKAEYLPEDEVQPHVNVKRIWGMCDGPLQAGASGKTLLAARQS